MMDDLLKTARQFATQAHRRIDQVRRYSGQPYAVHLKAVAQLVAGCTDDCEMVAAAWLHDAVEDCLQLLEKAGILLQNPGQLQEIGLETRCSARQVMKDIQSLRNNLAHAQDIVVHDWPQIVRLAQRLEWLVEESPDAV